MHEFHISYSNTEWYLLFFQQCNSQVHILYSERKSRNTDALVTNISLTQLSSESAGDSRPSYCKAVRVRYTSFHIIYSIACMLTSSLTWSNFILPVPVILCWRQRSCMSSTFCIAMLNDTFCKIFTLR